MNKIIIFLIIYGIAMFIAFIILLISYSKKEWRLPPSSCPDFWVKGSDNYCYNLHKIQYEKFLTQPKQKFDLDEENIKKYKLGGVNWDGITYGI